jgi:hypothetical protein
MINVLGARFTPAQMLRRYDEHLTTRLVGDRVIASIRFSRATCWAAMGMLSPPMTRGVRWRIGVDYAATHTYLLSYHDLARAL